MASEGKGKVLLGGSRSGGKASPAGLQREKTFPANTSEVPDSPAWLPLLIPSCRMQCYQKPT